MASIMTPVFVCCLKNLDPFEAERRAIAAFNFCFWLEERVLYTCKYGAEHELCLVRVFSPRKSRARNMYSVYLTF
jgi:hypothetical protein